MHLNDLKLTLGSSDSDLEISSDLTIDNSNEQILTGPADFKLSGFLTASSGVLSSTSGTISLLGGAQLSGTGELDLTGSSFNFGGNLTSLRFKIITTISHHSLGKWIHFHLEL